MPNSVIQSPAPSASRWRRLVPWLVVGVAACLAYALVMPTWPDAEQKDTAAVAAGPASAADCLPLSNSKADYFSSEANARAIQRLISACRSAHAERPDDPTIKTALGKALTTQDRAEAVALLRSAAADNDAEANYQIYEQHKSWDRHHDRPQLVTRVEAEGGLRRAAQLGHPFATHMLAILLDRGSTVKRNSAEALVWAARAAELPSAEMPRANTLLFIARLQATSDDSAERGRARDKLEKIAAAAGTYNAKTVLARFVRPEDPVRARQLLEAALRPDPGGATPPLADMLIKGEGGPADPARALKLLRAVTDVGAVSGAIGELYLEGRLVPRDIPKAIDLIRHDAVFNLDASIRVTRLLAAHPEVNIDRPEIVRYDAAEAAELGEPGALAAWIDLKLSRHPQFADRAGGCELVRQAATRGDDAGASHLAGCRAN